jgi:hypothetical protein
VSEKPFSEALFQTLNEDPEHQKRLRKAAERLIAKEGEDDKKLGKRLLTILDIVAANRPKSK